MNQQLIDKYTEQFNNILIKKYSFTTRHIYKKKLLKFLNEYKGDVKKATPKNLTQYIHSMKKENGKKAGINQMAQMHGALRLFYIHVLNLSDFYFWRRRDIIECEVHLP
jgi:hypothetical protein